MNGNLDAQSPNRSHALGRDIPRRPQTATPQLDPGSYRESPRAVEQDGVFAQSMVERDGSRLGQCHAPHLLVETGRLGDPRSQHGSHLLNLRASLMKASFDPSGPCPGIRVEARQGAGKGSATSLHRPDAQPDAHFQQSQS
jgi:hypothetical protein